LTYNTCQSNYTNSGQVVDYSKTDLDPGDEVPSNLCSSPIRGRERKPDPNSDDADFAEAAESEADDDSQVEDPIDPSELRNDPAKLPHNGLAASTHALTVVEQGTKNMRRARTRTIPVSQSTNRSPRGSSIKRKTGKCHVAPKVHNQGKPKSSAKEMAALEKGPFNGNMVWHGNMSMYLVAMRPEHIVEKAEASDAVDAESRTRTAYKIAALLMNNKWHPELFPKSKHPLSVKNRSSRDSQQLPDLEKTKIPALSAPPTLPLVAMWMQKRFRVFYNKIEAPGDATSATPTIEPAFAR
jgi:hypothetical protein